jgi:hypothetical protein
MWRHVDGKRIALHLAVAEPELGPQFVMSGRERRGQVDPQRDALLLAGRQAELRVPRDRVRKSERPACLAAHRHARVVDRDQLFLHCVARTEVVILARERRGLAGNVAQ